MNCDVFRVRFSPEYLIVGSLLYYFMQTQAFVKMADGFVRSREGGKEEEAYLNRMSKLDANGVASILKATDKTFYGELHDLVVSFEVSRSKIICAMFATHSRLPC
ncbi:hypothetical protein Ciccas_007161 [Cichlidogyrus casuarinus]|uniref:Uncharacterized protein n=1 Tax=Cichlidogyrus casuarinus TaxID=1844966 RepID=A0ABD2Q3N1_9PLAT